MNCRTKKNEECKQLVENTSESILVILSTEHSRGVAMFYCILLLIQYFQLVALHQ